MTGPITADQWNELFRQTKYTYSPAGLMTEEGQGMNLPVGTIPGFKRRPPGFVHPWTMIPYWNDEMELTEAEQRTFLRHKGAWCVNVVPGFVNGFEPVMKMPIGFLPKKFSVFGNRYGKLDVSAQEKVEVLLTDKPEPFLKLASFRDNALISYQDGISVPGDVPPFFAFLGARSPEQLDPFQEFINDVIISDRNTATPTDPFAPDKPSGGQQLIIDVLAGTADIPPKLLEDSKLPYGPRVLMSCEVVLRVDRPAVLSDFVTDEFGLVRISGFLIKPPQRAGFQTSLHSVAKYHVPLAPTFADRYLGTFVENNFDELPIGKLYFLSSEKDISPTPDGSWAVFTQGAVFWNLNYASINTIDPFKQDDSFAFFKVIGAVLGVGAAGSLIGTYADLIEAGFDQVMTALNKTATNGYFWTC